mmetsp:Transcript_5852/g.13631  ORF Transcript_5852/g.13631 Transcript_5852/m.13631 type:complete len:261 (-) Transcript_5852:714-1496(-)
MVHVAQFKELGGRELPGKQIHVVTKTEVALLKDMPRPGPFKRRGREKLLESSHHTESSIVIVAVVPESILAFLECVARFGPCPHIRILECLWPFHRQRELVGFVGQGCILCKIRDWSLVHCHNDISNNHRNKILGIFHACHNQIHLSDGETSSTSIIPNNLHFELFLDLWVILAAAEKPLHKLLYIFRREKGITIQKLENDVFGKAGRWNYLVLFAKFEILLPPLLRRPIEAANQSQLQHLVHLQSAVFVLIPESEKPAF